MQNRMTPATSPGHAAQRAETKGSKPSAVATAAALASAAVTYDAVYTTPPETHNPIELHASVAVFKDGKFTLYETSQAVANHRVMRTRRHARRSPRGHPVGYALPWLRASAASFGPKPTLLAASCARNLNRPVKPSSRSRSMMSQSVGHRPARSAHPTRRHSRRQATAIRQTTSITLDEDYDEAPRRR